MFRDLKEYQEIQELYSEKVSKLKELDENRNTRGSELAAKRLADKPKTREEVGLKPKVTSFADRRAARTGYKKPEKPMPTTAEIRAKNPKVVPGTRVNEIGAQGGGKPSEGNFKKDFPDKKPEVSTMTKQGKPRTKAQMMAAKRIADGKSISDVKAANTASMKSKAAERNQKFQAAKKSGNLAQFRKDNPKMSGADRAKQMAKDRLAKKAAMANEEFTPYDIVLEYLLSSEQAATIEEANYVMTEMDAETIQGIVEEQKKNFDEGIGQMPVVNVLGGLLATGAAIKGAASYLGRKAGEKSIKNKQTKPVPTPKKDPIKDLIPNIKKRNKGLKDAINQI